MRKLVPFDDVVFNDEPLFPPAEYVEAYAVISTSRGWKKWPKVISKKVYDRICEDARLCINEFRVKDPEKAYDEFITLTIDYYIDHGTLREGYRQYLWELGLFAIFKRRIDEAIARRARAIRQAALRRQRKLEEKALQDLQELKESQPAAMPATPPAEEPAQCSSDQMNQCLFLGDNNEWQSLAHVDPANLCDWLRENDSGPDDQCEPLKSVEINPSDKTPALTNFGERGLTFAAGAVSQQTMAEAAIEAFARLAESAPKVDHGLRREGILTGETRRLEEIHDGVAFGREGVEQF